MEVTCPICYDHYNDKDKIPRILSCGHTFCQHCLMDLRTSNILTCPTCRTYFSPDVKQLIKNFTILDCLNNEKAQNLLQKIEQQEGAVEESKSQKIAELQYCVRHPQKKCKYFCENDQVMICSKCIVADHKGHRISDMSDNKNIKVFQRRAQILKKKIDASSGETEIFSEELQEIEDQLQSTRESTVSELEEKFEVLIEMLKNRKDTLSKSVKSHYKKQEIYLLEAQKNIERRAMNLQKLDSKLQTLIQANQSESKLERLESEFLQINKSYDSPFHQFKHCTVSLHLQHSNQLFESMGNLKYGVVQFSNKHSFKFFNSKVKPITKCYFFGDSNNPQLILQYDFSKDLWTKKFVPDNLVLQSYAMAIGLNDGCILITGGLNSSFTNVSGQVYMYDTINETAQEKATLLQSRYTHSLAHSGNFVYAIGGRSINGVLDGCERFSISLNKWETIAKLNQKRCTMPAIVFEESYIYVFGGYEGSGRIDSIEQYDITNDAWTVMSVKFPLSVEAESGTLVSGNEVVILGGHDNSAGTKDAMILNLENFSFVKLAPMPYSRFLHCAQYYNNSIYVFGGADNCSCQKMSLTDFQWYPTSTYQEFINYNLQTFSSAGV